MLFLCVCFDDDAMWHHLESYVGSIKKNKDNACLHYADSGERTQR